MTTKGREDVYIKKYARLWQLYFCLRFALAFAPALAVGGVSGPAGSAKLATILFNYDFKINRDILRMEYDSNIHLKQEALDNLVQRAKSDFVWIEPVW